MDNHKLQNTSPPSNGALSASLFGGRAMHGEHPPAIDRSAVLEEWRRLWKTILKDLTPLQRRALDLELSEEAE